CGPTQFAVTAGTLTASPTSVPVPVVGGLSLAISRGTANPATMDVLARFALSPTSRVELPVRITLP
ncbi:MAG: hypothetical protein ACRC0L_07990, partial [Angustibacter sp.]